MLQAVQLRWHSQPRGLLRLRTLEECSNCGSCPSIQVCVGSDLISSALAAHRGTGWGASSWSKSRSDSPRGLHFLVMMRLCLPWQPEPVFNTVAGCGSASRGLQF